MLLLCLAVLAFFHIYALHMYMIEKFIVASSDHYSVLQQAYAYTVRTATPSNCSAFLCGTLCSFLMRKNIILSCLIAHTRRLVAGQCMIYGLHRDACEENKLTRGQQRWLAICGRTKTLDWHILRMPWGRRHFSLSFAHIITIVCQWSCCGECFVENAHSRTPRDDLLVGDPIGKCAAC